MDWSSVYEDEGEESGDWVREEEESCRTSMLHSFSANGTYTPFICYAFTVNYILGVGCLGVPYAFLQSGILLGTALVVVLSFVSYVTVMWIAVASQQEVSLSIYRAASNPFIVSPSSALARRKKYMKQQRQATEQTPLLPSKGAGKEAAGSTLGHYYASISNLMEKTGDRLVPIVEKERRKESRRQSALSDEEVISSLKELEVTDLAHEFLGPLGKACYQFSLLALTYVGLLAYAQVFSSTFQQQIWPEASIALPSLLFGLVVVPLSCLDLSEQVEVQLVMSLLRFAALGVLLFGTLVALYLDYEHSALRTYARGGDSPASIPFVDWSGFSVMFTTAIFSQLFQHSVPGLIRPLSAQDKKEVPRIFSLALLTTASLYIVIGCVTVLYFGSTLKQSVNLNFIDFSWGMTSHLALRLTSPLAMLVVLFPALDTLSVFPLIAITLGNNLHTAFPVLDLAVYRSNRLGRRDKERTKRIVRTTWRLVASIPPILLSVFVSDLVVSLQIAGLCGIIVALIVPALLHEQTESRLALVPPSLKTSLLFPDYFTSRLYVYVVIGLGSVAVMISLYQMIGY